MGKMRAWGAAFALLLICTSAQAATVELENQDMGTGHGFDDDQSVAPLASNDATTLGEQRLAAFRFAAEIVASRIASDVPIRIQVSFAGNIDRENLLACERNSATLGQGGTTEYAVNFSGAPQANVAYPLPLANALAGQRLADRAGIALSFNPRLDTASEDCLQATTWYYGLDGEPGEHQLDFVATAVHELLHGLGFQTLAALSDDGDTEVGQFPRFTDTASTRFPDIFSTYIQYLGLPGQPYWPSMSVEQRAESMTDGPNLVWGSSTTNSAAGGYLSTGLTQGRVQLYAPPTIDAGSSVSHWAMTLTPAQIMAPRENPDVEVLHGLGLSICALEDLGWQLANGTRCPDIDSAPIAGDPDSEITSEADSSNADADDDDSGGGGGGGCTLNPNAAFDPLWLIMLSLAGGVLFWRRRSV